MKLLNHHGETKEIEEIIPKVVQRNITVEHCYREENHEDEDGLSKHATLIFSK